MKRPLAAIAAVLVMAGMLWLGLSRSGPTDSGVAPASAGERSAGGRPVADLGGAARADRGPPRRCGARGCGRLSRRVQRTDPGPAGPPGRRARSAGLRRGVAPHRPRAQEPRGLRTRAGRRRTRCGASRRRIDVRRPHRAADVPAGPGRIGLGHHRRRDRQGPRAPQCPRLGGDTTRSPKARRSPCPFRRAAGTDESIQEP